MQKYYLILPILIFSIFWLLFVKNTGTIDSGVHFQDDHEIISINTELKEKNYNVLSVYAVRMHREINETQRFRPFYYFHRVLEVVIFKDNFYAISVYNLILIILTSSVLFYFALGWWLIGGGRIIQKRAYPDSPK